MQEIQEKFKDFAKYVDVEAKYTFKTQPDPSSNAVMVLIITLLEICTLINLTLTFVCIVINAKTGFTLSDVPILKKRGKDGVT